VRQHFLSVSVHSLCMLYISTSRLLFAEYVLMSDGPIQLPSICATCATGGAHTWFSRQALLSAHGNNE